MNTPTWFPSKVVIKASALPCRILVDQMFYLTTNMLTKLLPVGRDRNDRRQVSVCPKVKWSVMIGASVTSPFFGSSLNKGGISVTSQRGFVFCAKPVRKPVSVTRMLPRFSTWGESAGIIFMRWSL